jgi:hypothetical protein
MLHLKFFQDKFPKKKIHLIDMKYFINSIEPCARISPSTGAKISQSTPLEDQRLRRSTQARNLPLGHVCVLVLSYAMPCDHSGPTYAMQHMPESLDHICP